MKKPKSMLNLFSLFFLIFGIIFIIGGLLTKIGIMPTHPGSKFNPAIGFPIFGCIDLVVGILIYPLSCYKERKRKFLLLNGLSVKAKVTHIKQLSFIRWFNQSPYVVYFVYENEGVRYRGKSHLLWGIPKLLVEDNVIVFIDKHMPHNCAIDL